MNTMSLYEILSMQAAFAKRNGKNKDRAMSQHEMEQQKSRWRALNLLDVSV
jgi:hypothetical protein